MLITILKYFGFIAIYLGVVLICARCMSINQISWAKKVDWPKYPKDRRKAERRKRQAPIIYNHRNGDRRRRWQVAGNSGAVLVVVTVCMATFMLGFVYLAIDTGYLAVAKAEGQNCADAAALAGASALYDSSQLRPEFALMTEAAASANELAAANGCDNCTVTLGHWSHAGRSFEPGALGSVPVWQESSAESLDSDRYYTNSVSVECAKTTTAIMSGYNTTGVTMALAMVRVSEAPEPEPGMVVNPGSALVK